MNKCGCDAESSVFRDHPPVRLQRRLGFYREVVDLRSRMEVPERSGCVLWIGHGRRSMLGSGRSGSYTRGLHLPTLRFEAGMGDVLAGAAADEGHTGSRRCPLGVDRPSEPSRSGWMPATRPCTSMIPMGTCLEYLRPPRGRRVPTRPPSRRPPVVGLRWDCRRSCPLRMTRSLCGAPPKKCRGSTEPRATMNSRRGARRGECERGVHAKEPWLLRNS